MSVLLGLAATVAVGFAQEGDLGDEIEDGPAARYVANWQLPKGDGLYERWDPDRSWAASHVVSTIQVVAERMALELPLADPLMIGDISRKGGGGLLGHKTHNLGIDVDIGMFMDDQRQPLGGFVDVTPQHLDVDSTWMLVTAMIDTGQVQFILLDQSLIDRLHDYVLHDVGLEKNLVNAMFPAPGRRLTWSLRNVFRHAPNHKNHLHVRFTPPLTLEDPPIGFGRGSRRAIASPTLPAWY
ncbi:MAG: penicillin-insensitive murein endopeptidase [Myxococcota bacterium]